MVFESSGFEEGTDAVVDEVAEPEGGASEVF
ncbi:hypothetical protein F4555_000440 [Mobiluncus mulieris]|nr:hypothetical protein [Mobiluncus mulieris]